MDTVLTIINAVATIIAVIALAFVLFLVIRYLVREKRKGNKCIGCPYAGECMKYSDCGSGSQDHK